MTRNECAICGELIQPDELEVEISAEPYNLRPGGAAHLECAEDACINAIAARTDAMHEYFRR